MTVIEHAHRPARISSARERILSSSYVMFAKRGTRAVTIDEIIAHSGVAKATLYRHFPSKDDLILAFLDRREQQWTFGTVLAGARDRSPSPEGQLLAVFDVFDDWFRRADFEACSFVNVLLELGSDHPAGKASITHLAKVRSIVAELATAAGIPRAEEFARSWHILVTGSIVQAAEGDSGSAKRAQNMTRGLIQQFRAA